MPSNIYQADNGTYYARIQIKGRDVRRSLRTTDRGIARQRLKDLIKEAGDLRAGVKPVERHTWEDACVRWADLQLAELRPGTQKRYRTSLRQLNPYFAGRDIAAITTTDVHDYATARRRKKTSGATVRRDLLVMSRVMKVARRAGWITVNPVPDEMGEIKERREPIHPARLIDLARLTHRTPPGFRDLIRFLARTGCRQEEGASIEWTHLDLGAKPTATFTRTKTRSPRVIELSPQTARELRRLKVAADAEKQRARAISKLVSKTAKESPDYVFKSPSGARYSNVPGRFRVLIAKAISDPARHFRCHDLRHTYAIRALQKGASIYAVARQLGHSSVKTTEGYTAWLSRAAV